MKKCNDLDVMTKERDILLLSVTDIEDMISRPEYATVPTAPRATLSDKDIKDVQQFENINSFGAEVADLFEDLCDELHRIPTQAEYVDKGVELTEVWWMRAMLKHNPLIAGIKLEGAVLQACKDRLARGYLSLVNEVHTMALVKQLFPTARVISHDILDLVMGVDLVVEYSGKRLYIHVYKNSYWGVKAFHRKEKRGGMRNKQGEFVKYRRSFKGDVCLLYDSCDSDTTKHINGIPVFTEDYIEWSINRAVKDKEVGEPLSADKSKLDKLNDWLWDNFSEYIDFYD